MENRSSERRFCIKDGSLFVLETDSPCSHEEWFEKEGWLDDHPRLIDEIVRGKVDTSGNVNFYVGEDWQIYDWAEEVFFHHLPDLVAQLNISHKATVYGGLKKLGPDEKWPPRKTYGAIEVLANNIKQ